jgi:NAD(P)H-dependent flavin oxidoreductase YrpB (nitropropane dioxygenase family)
MDRVERANRPDLFSTPAGQVVGMMNEDTTCKEILYRMQKEFAEATESLEAVTQHLGS